MLVPIMASHLMLSLKKAAIEPAGPWLPNTMSNLSVGRSREGETLRFASQRLAVTREVPEFDSSGANEGDAVELRVVLTSHWNGESRMG